MAPTRPRDAAQWAADLAAIWGAPLHLLTAVLGTAAAPASSLLAELRDAAVRAGARTVVTETVHGEIVEFVPCPVVVTGHEAGVMPAPRLAQVTGATS